MTRSLFSLRSMSLQFIALVLTITSVTAFLISAPVSADRPNGYGYFSNIYFGTSTRAVIWYDDLRYGGNSLPIFNNKEEFINHILYLYNGDGSTWQQRNRIGSYYIIQKMRGGTDYAYPDGADIADWAARIRQSNVTMVNEYAVDTRTSAYQNSGGVDDDFKYVKSSGVHNDLTVSFYQNGALVFRIRYNCGNPLDDLAGLSALNFDLLPTITGNPDVAESGSPITLSPQVQNRGTTASATVQWQVNRFQVGPGQPVPGGGTNGSVPSTHFSSGTSNFANVSSGSRSFPINYTPINVATQTLGDLPVGTQQCYALSVQPVRHDNNNWRHSTPFCVTVAKKPKLQVEGSDVFVGKGGTSNIVTSTTRKSVSGQNRTFGSWGEYAVAATGTITGMASGAGYSGGNTGTDFCLVSFLTITNAGGTACGVGTPKGQYALNPILPDLAARFTGAQNTGGVIDVSTVANGVYTRNGAGPMRIRASGDIAPGHWVVINAPNTPVIIEDDIRYSGSALSRLSDIPQVVIIANTIEIEPAVSQIDSWLVASGTTGRINTCRGIPFPLNNVDNRLHAGRCNVPLVVNGPVMARQLVLYRTAGSGTGADSGDPAETFNLRPDAYLWATNFNSAAGRIPTVSTTELPPRF